MAYCTWKSYKLKVDPFGVFEVLKKEKNCFFLDSSLSADYSLGRYSFLGFDPFCILRTKDHDPFIRLKELLHEYKVSSSRKAPPFLGGAVGYLGYDLGFILEKKIKKSIVSDLEIPDSFFAFYNTAIIIDNFKKNLHIFTVGFPEKKYHLAKALCESNLKKIERLLSAQPLKRPEEPFRSRSPNFRGLESNLSKKDYLRAVGRAKRHIKNGDIYQVNLSQRFRAQTDLSGTEIYRRLRKLSPSYFSAYLDCGDFQILSSSPERFIKLSQDTVTTRPMKGTRPRGENTKEDRDLKKELMQSVKDKAELTMIVDLERNDLGRVCRYDSIKVNTLRQLEKYNTVFQTTATISGRLHKDKDAADLLRACFPGGSITGCPKIRAMEIIEELEPSRRAVYTGALGYISFSGNLDFNILIRTILKKESNIYFSVGGGIVADSQALDEYQETLVKAKALMQAIG